MKTVLQLGACGAAAFVGLSSFLMYSFQRTSSGPFTRSLADMLGHAVKAAGCGALPALIFGLAAMGFLSGKFDLRTERRIAARLCPRCSYPRGATNTCSECGCNLDTAPRNHRLWSRGGPILVIILLAAWLGGSTVAELVISVDERAFRREVARLKPTTVYWRKRAWPPNGELSFDPVHGYWTVDD